MEQTLVRIRGMYATALTRLLLANGVGIADPSDPILERFKNDRLFRFGEEPDAEIHDRNSRQGVILSGNPESVQFLAELLRQSFFDLICWEFPSTHWEPYRIAVEFPATAKSSLDRIRAQITPTIRNHHWLKTIDSDAVARIEDELATNPGQAEILVRLIEDDLIWSTYVEAQSLELEHVKTSGRTLYLKKPRIHRFDAEKGELILKRTGFKPGGRYDGLRERIEDGDFSVSHAIRGQWHYRHTYYRRDGRPIGAYYNINTPIELYPDRIRYVDLEIDVVRWVDGRVAIIDQKELEDGFRAGHISGKLRDEAQKIADEVKAIAESEELRPSEFGV